MYSNWHCWHKRQSLIIKVLLKINIKNWTMFIQLVFPKVENVEIPLCYKILKRHRPPCLQFTWIITVLTLKSVSTESEKVKSATSPFRGFTLLCFPVEIFRAWKSNVEIYLSVRFAMVLPKYCKGTLHELFATLSWCDNIYVSNKLDLQAHIIPHLLSP